MGVTTETLRIFVEALGVRTSAKQLDEFSNKIKNWADSFSGWALSVLFFGMAITRTFSRIAKAGVSAFTKVMESSNIAGTAIQRLGFWFEFLKFTIGAAINRAIEPFLAQIIRIITRITEWIQKNPELTAKIIAWGLAIGTVSTAIGLLTLSFKGIIAGLLRLSPIVEEIGVIFEAFSLGEFALIAAALVGAAAIWASDLGDIHDTVKDFIDGILSLFGDFATDLKNVIGSAFDLLVGFLEGDNKKIIASFEALVTNVIALFKNLATNLLTISAVLTIGMLKMFDDLGAAIVNFINEFILQRITDMMNQLGGILRATGIPGLTKFGKDLQKVGNDISKVGDAGAESFENFADATNDALDNVLELIKNTGGTEGIGEGVSILSPEDMANIPTSPTPLGPRRDILEVQVTGTVTTKEMMDEIANTILRGAQRNQTPALPIQR